MSKVIEKIDEYLSEKNITIPTTSKLGLKASKFNVTDKDMPRASTIGAMSYLIPEFTNNKITPLSGTSLYDIVISGDDILVKWTTRGRQMLKTRNEKNPNYFNDVLKVFVLAYKKYFSNLKT